jgi:hypothetical protein
VADEVLASPRRLSRSQHPEHAIGDMYQVEGKGKDAFLTLKW